MSKPGNSTNDIHTEDLTCFQYVPFIYNANQAIPTHPFILKGLDGDVDNTVNKIFHGEAIIKLLEFCGTEASGTEAEAVCIITPSIKLQKSYHNLASHIVANVLNHSHSSSVKSRHDLVLVLPEYFGLVEIGQVFETVRMAGINPLFRDLDDGNKIGSRPAIERLETLQEIVAGKRWHETLPQLVVDPDEYEHFLARFGYRSQLWSLEEGEDGVQDTRRDFVKSNHCFNGPSKGFALELRSRV